MKRKVLLLLLSFSVLFTTTSIPLIIGPDSWSWKAGLFLAIGSLFFSLMFLFPLETLYVQYFESGTESLQRDIRKLIRVFVLSFCSLLLLFFVMSITSPSSEGTLLTDNSEVFRDHVVMAFVLSFIFTILYPRLT